MIRSQSQPYEKAYVRFVWMIAIVRFFIEMFLLLLPFTYPPSPSPVLKIFFISVAIVWVAAAIVTIRRGLDPDIAKNERYRRWKNRDKSFEWAVFEIFSL